MVTQYVYNAAGWVQDVIDPMGLDTRTLYDNLGRTTKTIQDYTGGTPGNENDITTEYGYDGNNNTIYVRADEPGGFYQQTQYVYGVTTAAGDGVNSNDILSAVQHPDPTTGQPSSSQQDSYLVNALGQVTQYTDRNGNVHQYSYDVLGRIASDAVTTLGAGVDGSVRRIEYGYDSQGNLSLITSYDAPSAGNIVNQVQRVFNGLGQLTGEYQSLIGAVVQSSTPEVQYAYTEMSGGQNNSRLVSMTYPDGYTLDYNYNTGLDSNISRLSSISDSTGVLESYKYLGLSTVVERDHPQINVNQTYISQNGQTGDAGDPYTGLDRFGRVVDQNWVNSTTGVSTDNFQYGYNPDGDVLYRQNLVDAVMSELYQYDNLHQLINFQRGTLNSTDTGIVGTPSASQSWSPDALGNFNSITTNGTTQTRTANQQNEITGMSGAGTLTYDNNGNLTADGSGNTYKYDAWNRLVSVSNNGTTLASYSYDGLDRRITETDGSTTTDLYLSAADQVLEEDVSGVTQARNVWSPVYVNALILRDQSSQHNGVLDQRLYVQQDANWNVTALVDTSGNVVERYTYSPYGSVTVLNPDFSVRGSSVYAVPYGFQGMRADLVVSLQFADNRVYSPTLMRWLQTDPISLNAGNNDYAFVGNGPTEAVDPSGFYEWYDFIPFSPVVTLPANGWDYFQVWRRGRELDEKLNEVREKQAGDPVAVMMNPNSRIQGADGLTSARSAINATADVNFNANAKQGQGDIEVLAQVGMAASPFGIPFAPTRGLAFAGSLRDLQGFERQVGECISREKNTLIGVGDSNVRRVLSIPETEPVADFLAVTAGGKFNITEVKGSIGAVGADVEHALEQLKNTVAKLKAKVPDAKIGTLEIAVPTGGNLAGNYEVRGNQLIRIIDGKKEVIKIDGQVVTIRRATTE